jgi:tetratricopeptide (TPR) repeat protein
LGKAEKFFLESLDWNPLDYRAYIGLAFNYLRKSDFDKDEEVRKIDFDKAEELLTNSLPHAPHGIMGPGHRNQDMTEEEEFEAELLADLRGESEEKHVQVSQFDYKSLSHRLIGRIWACRGDYGRAAAELQSAIELSPDYPEGNYDYALYCVQSGTTSGWEEPLRRAITAEPGYLNVAWVERRFALARQGLESLLSGLLNEAYQNASSAIQDAETKSAEAQCAVANAPDAGRYKPRVNEIANLLATAKSDRDSNDYVKILTALEDATQAVGLSCSLVQQRVQERAQQALAARIAKSEKGRRNAESAMMFILGSMICFPPLAIVGIIIGIQALSDFKQGLDQQGKGKAIVAVLIGSFVLLGLCFLIFYSIMRASRSP